MLDAKSSVNAITAFKIILQSLPTAVISGSCSGAISILVFQPLDLLKTRIQIDKQNR